MCVCVCVYTHTYIYTYRIFIRVPVDGYLGCFSVLVIESSAAVNFGVHISFQTVVFSGKKIVGSYGSSVFSFLRDLHNFLHSDYMNLHSHQH